ncbi:MAG: hypothetical protein LH632_08335 [Rhodoferax sp.]|nr:hypothetical protein [Rhodoferax sp.]
MNIAENPKDGKWSTEANGTFKNDHSIGKASRTGPQPACGWSSASPDQNHKVLLAAMPRTLSQQARVPGSTRTSTLTLWRGTSVVQVAAPPVQMRYRP